MNKIKLYMVEYIPEDEADDITAGTFEIFLHKDQAFEFADTIDEALLTGVYRADFNSDRVFIEDSTLNYEDCSDLYDWDSMEEVTR